MLAQATTIFGAALMDANSPDTDTMWSGATPIWALGVVLLLVLVLVLAVLITWDTPEPVSAFVTGGGPPSHNGGPPSHNGGPPSHNGGPPSHIGDTIFHVFKDHPAHQTPLGTVSIDELDAKTTLVLGGDAKVPLPRKPWTEYPTWSALAKDTGATRVYINDFERAVSRLKLDWSDVREELKHILYADREWVGRINMVDGRLKIVEKQPSPLATGDVGDRRGAAAIVPGELVAEISQKPALFFFHTHPGENTNATMPSAADVLTASFMAFSNHYAANLVISPYGVFVYRPSAALITAVKRSDDCRLSILRRAADTSAAISGARSWIDPWTLDDYTAQLNRYGIELYIFPTDKYASMRYRTWIKVPGFAHDFDEIQTLYEDVAARERALEDVMLKRVRKKVTGPGSASNGGRGPT